MLLTKQLTGKTKQPRASFLFVGDSGVGKSYLSEVLAQDLFYHNDAYLRLDMSEFTQGHSTSKLLGSPAGYVGYKDRNKFIEHIKKRPHSVIVFDEIDKAHPNVSKLLLQILEQGKLTDSSGQSVSFEHAVIILTANIGQEIYKKQSFGFDHGNNKDQAVQQKKQINNKVKKFFSPSLVSRLDSVCVFNQLSKQDLLQIALIKVKQINAHIKEQHSITIKVQKKSLQSYINNQKELSGRMVEREIEVVLYQLLVKEFKNKSQKKTFTLSYKDNKLCLI